MYERRLGVSTGNQKHSELSTNPIGEIEACLGQSNEREIRV